MHIFSTNEYHIVDWDVKNVGKSLYEAREITIYFCYKNVLQSFACILRSTVS